MKSTSPLLRELTGRRGLTPSSGEAATTARPQREATTRFASRVPTLRPHGRRGLTIVEIMVVIAILGTLMTIIAVNVIGSLDDANVDATSLQIKKVEQGLQMYATKHKGKYPSTSDGLEAAKKYFANNDVPTDAWGNEFQYFSPGQRSGRDYEIISLGKDGQEGGEGANADIYSWEEGSGDD